MSRIGAGDRLYTLRQEIESLRGDLEALGEPADMPEMVDSANLLRSKEHLSRSGAKKTELLGAYSKYCDALEEMLLAVFEIQKDLRDIMQEQSKMLEKRR